MTRKKRRGSTSHSANAPRLDPESRILSRFYEPLILLCVLGKTRGEHRPAAFPRSSNITTWELKYARRLFINSLAVLCDYDTGGDSASAIAIECTPERRIFWVAANTCPKRKIVPFLESCISSLRRVALLEMTEDDAMSLLLATAVTHAEPRVKAYAKYLKKLRPACQVDLRDRTVSSGESCEYDQFMIHDAKLFSLLSWYRLIRFPLEEGNLQTLCVHSYESRQSSEMAILKYLCLQQTQSLSGRRSCRAADYKLLRHYIGRLGQYVKVVKLLLVLAPRLSFLFDDYEVQSISPAPRVRPPQVDGKTNLNSIAVRMLPSRSPDLPRYQQSLAEMDQRFQIHQHFVRLYSDPNFRPRVHAEIQLLDHFHRRNLTFEDADVFIGASKPACYCCSLYFQHHPLRPVLPASHQTVYRNWRPPDFECNDNTQRDILNKIIKDVRDEVLRQIEQRRPNVLWHPDSTTGITESIAISDDQCLSNYASEASEEVDDIGDDISDLSSLALSQEIADQELETLLPLLSESSASMNANVSVTPREESLAFGDRVSPSRAIMHFLRMMCTCWLGSVD